MAPEILLLVHKISYTRKVDIWSLGCILYELAVGSQLFEDNYYAMRCKDTGVLPDIVFNSDSSFCDGEEENIRSTVSRMLRIDPEERPTATELVREFSSNYASTTWVASPENIEIYQEFTPTYVAVTRAEFTTTHQLEVGIRTSDQEDESSAKLAAKEPTEEAIIGECTDPPATVTPYTHTLSSSDDVPSLKGSQPEPAPIPATSFSAFTGPTPKPQSLHELQSLPIPGVSIYLSKLNWSNK